MRLSSFRKKSKNVAILFIIVLIFSYIFGLFDHIIEKDFYKDFRYPYDGDIDIFVQQLKNNITPDVKPINSYRFNYIKICKEKCSGVQSLRLLYLIKSAPENHNRRLAIRNTWGYEHRFSDVEIRTIFLLGTTSAAIQKNIDVESRRFGDIVQANFTDTYYNNTYKMMMGQTWAMKFCPNALFYAFVDDDYYISTKNVLRFVRHPSNYPAYLTKPMENVGSMLENGRRHLKGSDSDDGRLYAGYTFQSSPHRHLTSKWHVSLEEYPYHKWPPYVTAGAYIFSRGALIDMHYTSFYTKHFRFDDIYLGLMAYKAKIKPLHCEHFHFYKQSYNKFDFKYTVASHGYGDPDELMRIWTEQKILGNA